MSYEQQDMIWSTAGFYSVPRNTPGRINGDDFIFFYWPANINPARYTVVIESLDTAGPTYKGIGKLMRSVEIPHVKLGAHVIVGVIPDSESLPTFQGELIRGSTYIIPNVTKNGTYQLQRHGMHRPN
ncbi:MAG TPA: hypothetical protein VLE02_00905 [Nitrosarchaeum sp.]|nr:hypothetical protein [Nitrosarchaeum sp.]